MSCVLFKEHVTNDNHKIIEIILNAEKSLNALSFEMVKLLLPALEAYRTDDSVVAIVLDGSGEKAFCAGGDVVNLYKALQTSEGEQFATDYFTGEYKLDYIIHTYPKPIIAWGAGIVMGGGLGLLSGCAHKVVTQTTMIAMPEVTIGLYPDVGASWFLNKCPGRTGLFLGITGQRINASDAKYLGIADRLLDNEQRSDLFSKLLAAPWQQEQVDTALINNILRELEANSTTSAQSSAVQDHYQIIQQLTDVDSAAEFVEKLSSIDTDDSWLNKAQKSVSHGSPMSIAMIYRQLNASKFMSLKEAFISELSLSVQCCVIGELAEGVRALLVDKDGSPQWQFKTVESVDNTMLDRLFAPLGEHSPLADI